MTDVELKRLHAICEVANVDDIEDVSDGFHTFNSLYEQRMYLFAALVNAYKDKSWKSLRHEDGEHCFGGDWFIVGIDTPKGSYTYHYGIQYWDVFDCEILPRAKHWDGHTEKDVTRLMSLESKPNCSEEPHWIPCSERLPEDNREVEATCEVRRCYGKKYRYTCHASYVHRYSIESTDYCNWEDCDEYNEEEDKYYALSGWYERVHNWDDYSYCAIEDFVIAWRELPDPWRGEKNEYRNC